MKRQENKSIAELISPSVKEFEAHGGMVAVMS